MATELAKAYVQIIPSAQGMKEKISEILGEEVPGAGKTAGTTLGSSLVGSFTKVMATLGIGKVISDAFSEGADLQQSIGGVDTLFKESADIVKQYANEAYKTAGLSANEYMESVTGFSASLLQSLGGDTAKASEAANTALVDMSDNANKMGTSMELIQNAYQGFAKQNYTMLDNLKLGYGGTQKEMERLLADAEAFSGVSYDISNLSDVYEAIHVIQGEMGISGRTAEEAAAIIERTGRSSAEVYEQLGTTAKEGATTFSGALASMKAAATNLLGKLTLGEDISSELFALQETFQTFLFGNVLPMAKSLLSTLPDILDGLFTLVVQTINNIDAGEMVQTGINLVTGLADTIVYNIPYLLEAAWNLMSEFGKALLTTDWSEVGMNLLRELQGSLELNAGEILGAEGSFITVLAEQIQESLPTILNQGIQIVTSIVEGILQTIPTLLTTAGELLGQFAAYCMENLSIIWAAGTELLLQLVNGITEYLPAIAEPAIQTIAQFTETILKNLPQILESGISLISELIAGIISAIPDVVSAVWDIIVTIKDEFSKIDWLEVGTNILEGIKNGLLGGLDVIGDAAKEVGKKALGAVKEFLGIASPSKEFIKIGEFVTEGFAQGITQSSANVENALQKLTKVNMGDFALNATAGQGNGNGVNSDAVLELAKAISENPTKVIVTLEGDVKRLFRAMQSEARNNQLLTGVKV
ncbi:MAG: hypothetical protein E7299_04805 [Lachnospiraceae bacterium]|nr:hypothetical protein [Lachnospiraceae bacterium]